MFVLDGVGDYGLDGGDLVVGVGLLLFAGVDVG